MPVCYLITYWHWWGVFGSTEFRHTNHQHDLRFFYRAWWWLVGGDGANLAASKYYGMYNFATVITQHYVLQIPLNSLD